MVNFSKVIPDTRFWIVLYTTLVNQYYSPLVKSDEHPSYPQIHDPVYFHYCIHCNCRFSIFLPPASLYNIIQSCTFHRICIFVPILLFQCPSSPSLQFTNKEAENELNFRHMPENGTEIANPI